MPKDSDPDRAELLEHASSIANVSVSGDDTEVDEIVDIEKGNSCSGRNSSVSQCLAANSLKLELGSKNTEKYLSSLDE
jgi:hypothetical protein